MPRSTPIRTRTGSVIQSFANAYWRKNPTPSMSASAPIRLRSFPPIRASHSSFDRDFARTGGAAGRACGVTGAAGMDAGTPVSGAIGRRTGETRSRGSSSPPFRTTTGFSFSPGAGFSIPAIRTCVSRSFFSRSPSRVARTLMRAKTSIRTTMKTKRQNRTNASMGSPVVNRER